MKQLEILVFAPDSQLFDKVQDWSDQINDLNTLVGYDAFYYDVLGGVANNFSVSSMPTIVFYDRISQTTIGRLKGSSITQANYEAAIRQIDGLANNANGELIGQNGLVIGNGKEVSLGLGLFDLSNLFNFNLPKGLWLVLAAYGTYKSTVNKNTGVKVAYGLGSSLALAQFLKK